MLNDTRVITADSNPTPRVRRLIDEHCDVVGDALVGIVGSVAAEPHPIVHTIVEPVIEIAICHPSTPPIRQPLIDKKRIDGNDDEGCGNDHEGHEPPPERRQVLVLERHPEKRAFQ